MEAPYYSGMLRRPIGLAMGWSHGLVNHALPTDQATNHSSLSHTLMIVILDLLAYASALLSMDDVSLPQADLLAENSLDAPEDPDVTARELGDDTMEFVEG